MSLDQVAYSLVEYLKTIKKDPVEAVQLAAKKVGRHSLLERKLRDVHRVGDLVVAPGCGASFEQILFPNYKWLGLEVDPRFVDEANRMAKYFGVPDNTIVWDARKDPLPTDRQFPSKVLYLSHLCGGYTDICLQKAVDAGYRAMVVSSCCPHDNFEHTLKVHKDLSSNDEFTIRMLSKRAQSLDYRKTACEIMDRYRVLYLNNHGYSAKHQEAKIVRCGAVAEVFSCIVATKNP